MKSNKIFLIKVLSNPEVKLENRMLQEFCDCFEEGDEYNYAVHDVNGLDYIFLRFSDYKVDKVCKVLDRYIKYDLSEISGNLILGNEGDLLNIVKSDEFKSFFDSFRIDNTKIDDVLDKINVKGINALDDIDKDVLAKG
jgi:hypothetical protein